jgi:hypothetical protein
MRASLPDIASGPRNKDDGAVQALMQWNWSRLGEEVEQARAALVARDRPGHVEAARRFHRALDAAWPPGFFEELRRCARGEPEGLDDVLDFVEACPRFFRTGYILDKAMRFLPRPPRTAAQTQRLQNIVFAAVARSLRVPFRSVPALARSVDSPTFREKLRVLTHSSDARVRDRAAAVLDGLPGPPWDVERAHRQRQDQRIDSIFATAQRIRTPILIRRVFAIDPSSLTTRGRHLQAVAFELAMNLSLIPDDELLSIARRIDGPEMAPIWEYALGRSDSVGDRARAMLDKLHSQ